MKERFNISNEVYHELSMVNSDLLHSSQLHKRVNELDSQEHIFPTPGNTIGMQQSLRKRLQYRIHELRSKSESFQWKRTVRVKVTGDGTQISRNLHTVVIAFAVIDNEANPSALCGNHVLAILNIQEKYEEIREGLSDICNEVENLKTITVDRDEYLIEFLIGADLKFLALSTGIEAANAKYPCVWCKCPVDKHHV